ncbi:MAG: hypothetical protein ABIH48_00815 [Candidatus Falkowbacteria bacterium]
MFERLIPFIVAFISFISWELFIYRPQLFFIAFGIIIVATVGLLLKFNRYKIFDTDFWLLLTPPLVLIVFTTIFLLFLNYKYIQHGIALAVAIAIYYYLTYLYYFLRRITNYKPLSLESASSYFTVISYLFLSIVSYGFINFLNFKIWYLAIIFILLTFLSTYQFIWINKIGKRLTMFVSILISVLMIEFFWSISFFPISHFISGLALAIIYYVIINLSLLNFLEKIDKKVMRTYLSIGIICIFIILLSAKWL